MWQLKDICVAFDDRVILDGVNARFSPGDLVALQGANGSGKSTLFGVLAGTIRPSRGLVIRNGIDITAWDECSRAKYVGRLIQDPAVGCATQLSVAQNLALAELKMKRASLRPVQYDLRDNIKAMAEALGLPIEKLYNLPVAKLSGGQRQALALIMVLLSSPELLLLDEPTAALDPGTSKRLLDYVQLWVKQTGASAIMITHDTQEAESICNKHWRLQMGYLQVESHPG